MHILSLRWLPGRPRHDRPRPLSGLLLIALLAAACSTKSPEEKLEEANQWAREGDVLNAQFAYEEIIEQHPDTKAAIDARIGLAMCYLNDGDLTRAREQLDAYVDAVGLETEEGLGARVLKIRSYGQERQFEEAIAEAIATSNSLPMEQPGLLFELSQLYAADEQYDQALELLQYLLSREDQRPEEQMFPLERMAALYRQMGQPEKSVAVYEEYLEQHPDSPQRPEILFAIGDYQLQAGNEEAAEASFNASEALYHQQIDEALGAEEKSRLYLRMARVQELRGQVQAAIDSLRTVIDKYPTSSVRSEAQRRLATLLFSRGRFDQVLAVMEQALAESPVPEDALVIEREMERLKQFIADGVTSQTLFASMASTATLAQAGLTTASLELTEGEPPAPAETPSPSTEAAETPATGTLTSTAP